MKEDPNIDINAQNAIGFTALHYVVQNNRSDPHFWLFKELLTRPDINVNVKDERGKTPLHYVIGEYIPRSLSDLKLDALLAHKDILVNLKDNAGRTPVAIAREIGNLELATRLLTHPNNALSVTPHRKLATTWAALKKLRP